MRKYNSQRGRGRRRRRRRWVCGLGERSCTLKESLLCFSNPPAPPPLPPLLLSLVFTWRPARCTATNPSRIPRGRGQGGPSDGSRSTCIDKEAGDDHFKKKKIIPTSPVLVLDLLLYVRHVLRTDITLEVLRKDLGGVLQVLLIVLWRREGEGGGGEKDP